MMKTRRLLLVGLTAAVFAFTGCAGPPHVIRGFGQRTTYHLDGHLGLDLAALLDEPVIASADGVVHHAGPIQGPTVSVSLCVKLNHPPFGFQTIYCHLSKTPVTHGASVKRGDVIGFVGLPAIARGGIHLHFGLWPIAAGEWKTIQGFIDPTPFIVGCFDPKRTYPYDRFVLTYPIKCEEL